MNSPFIQIPTRWAGRLIFILIIIIIHLACPEPPEKLECGPNQIEVNGECQCQEGYHWNDDETECLMDTTSHNFIWSVDTLGYWGYLEDVEIIDENNIWVVGQILTDTATYNAAHWNGSEWELIRIQPEPYLFGQYTSVFGFSSDDIWFGSSIVVHWNGENFTPYGSNEGYPGGFYSESIWGSSSDDMYFVGNSGSIVHYDGDEFVQMESGTDVDLLNIGGTPDGEYVFITGYTNMFGVTASIALELVQYQLTILSYTDFHEPGSEEFGRIWSCHVLEDTVYFATGGGIWKYNYLSHSSYYLTNDKVNMGYRAYSSIGSNGVNDIIFFGSGMTYVHYNGSTWYRDEQFYPGYNFKFKSGDLKEDLAVMVGFMVENIFWQGIVTRGYRNQ